MCLSAKIGTSLKTGKVSMLKVFFGTDEIATRAQAQAYINKAADAGATVERVSAENFASGLLEDLAEANSLFGGEQVIVLDTPSQSTDFNETVMEKLSLWEESAHTFVVIEAGLLAPAKKKYTKHAVSLDEFTAEKAERFNTFAMADALAKKDKKQLWFLLQEAKAAGQSAEEIIGILWWQLKSLRLAASTTSAKEAGMKDFPYNKARRSLSNFKDGELGMLSRDLLALYHDGHAGTRDIDIALERWLLTL